MVDYLFVSNKIEDFISDKVAASGAEGIVLGLSGGVDSAVVASLCTKALGADKVFGLILPSETNSPHDVSDAKEHARALGIEAKTIALKPIVESFLQHLEYDRRSVGNLTARIRMCLIYYHANKRNYLVAGTGNKSELSVGYFTKYGDGGCDMLPIGDLYKTQVYDLARFLDVSNRIIEKAPSAGLWSGQTDEGELGVTYKELDRVLSGEKSDIRVQRMVNASEHKRKAAEVCKI